MLLPRKGNAATPIDVQRKQLPIYQAKPQLLNQLRQLHSAVLIGTVFKAANAAATQVRAVVVTCELCHGGVNILFVKCHFYTAFSFSLASVGTIKHLV